MTTIRKIFGFLITASMLVAFALPVAAQTISGKQFTFTMSNVAIGTSPATEEITVTNVSPDGVSVINSIVIVPPSGFVISGTCTVLMVNDDLSTSLPKSTTKCLPYNTTGNPTGLQVNGFTGLTSNATTKGIHSIRIRFLLASNNTCKTFWGSNNVLASTGNSPGSGSPMQLKSAPIEIGSDVCALSFSRNPANAFQNVIITDKPYNIGGGETVQVMATVGGSPSGVTPPITVVGTTDNSCGVGASTVTAAAGLANFAPVGTAPGNGCTLTASAPGFGTATSTAFNVTAPDGEIFCGDAINPIYANPLSGLGRNDPGYAEGFRGLWNKDGSSCLKVVYDFFNGMVINGTVSGSNEVSLIWDSQKQPRAMYSYTANWKLEPALTADGWPADRVPKVAWEVDGAGAGVFIFGQSCAANGPSAPVSLGTLAAGIGAGVSPISVSSPTAFPTAPFTIQVVEVVSGITYTEKMRVDQVISVTGSGPYIGSLGVARGVAATATRAFGIGSAVSILPLPGLPEPYATLAADMNASTSGTTGATITVTPYRTLPPLPFAAIIGSERVKVTGVSGTTWTVTRGDGVLLAGPLTLQPSGQLVMSNPMPLLTADAVGSGTPLSYYTPGTPAQMCVWAHGQVTKGSIGGVPQVMYSTSVMDGGDGKMAY